MKKTALVLSGGGSRGAYQIGVWQALMEMGIPIHMVVGTSVGAINGAAIALGAFSAARALWNELETGQVFDVGRMLKREGKTYETLKGILSQRIEEEAIRRSPVDFGLTAVEVAGREGLEARYLWKEDIPQGQLLDYILASASCFPAVKPYEIGGISYVDGGYADNMPIGMALERGADRIIAVNLNAIGVVRNDSIEEAEAAGKEVILIESAWDLGNFLVFDRDNAQHLLRLGYLDGLRAFGVYEGKRSAFIRGEMDRRTLSTAEEAGRIFDLDPELIYSKAVFLERLREAVEEERRDKANLKEMLTQGIRGDLRKLRAQLLMADAVGMIPSEARVQRFLRREGLL